MKNKSAVFFQKKKEKINEMISTCVFLFLF